MVDKLDKFIPNFEAKTGINIPDPVGNILTNGLKSGLALGQNLGKALDLIGSNVGKSVRQFNSSIKGSVPTLVKQNTSVTSSSATGVKQPKDWRVSISVPQRIAKYMTANNQGDNPNAVTGGLLGPLATSNYKMVFPYTPTILTSHNSNYNAMQPVHTNYPYYAYENSRVDQMTITGDFYVENEEQAKYWIAAVHFLRTVTKMNYGQGEDRGQPPPVCRLNGYGAYTFNNVPVIINNFQMDLKRDVDYISTDLSSVSGKPQGTDIAWVPTETLITVGVVPQYSRTKQSQFNLKEFVEGKNTLGGDGFI